MKLQLSEWTWLDERDSISLAELSGVCGMSPSEVDELVEYGALMPMEPVHSERVFSAECITQLRTAGKLRLDFDLDMFTVAMMLGYLTRIETLEREVRTLQALLPSPPARQQGRYNNFA